MVIFKKIIFRAFETFFEFIYKKLTALPSIYKLQMRIVQTFEKKNYRCIRNL